MKIINSLKSSILGLSFICFVTSCNQTQRDVAENIIQYDSLTINKMYQIPKLDPTLCCSLQLKFIFPSDYENKEILRKIQQCFITGFFVVKPDINTPQEAAQHYLTDYINAFQNDHVAYQDEMDLDIKEDSICFYSKKISNEIIYNQHQLISYVVYEEEDKGGAHNLHKYTNQVISLNKGTIVHEEEIFMEDFQEELSQILKEMIALNNSLENADELENIGFFVDEITPNNNFYVDNNGITYTFNEYDIAAYLVGTTSVHLPYEKIRHLLRKESPIAIIAF